MTIGDWVRREHGGKPHLVESIVAGDAVTKCGRRMADEPNSRGKLISDLDTEPCQICSGYRET